MQYTDEHSITHDLVTFKGMRVKDVHPKGLLPWILGKRFEKPANFVEVEERTGMLKWAEPQDAWIAKAPHANELAIVANFRKDDTPHCEDLFVYSNIQKSEKNALNFHVEDVMEENRLYLNRTRRWYVRQYMEQPDKAGVRGFVSLPLQTFLQLWRQPIDPRRLYIKSRSSTSGRFNVTYSGAVGEHDNWMSGIPMGLRWRDLLMDAKASDDQKSRGVEPCLQNERVLPWLRNHCSAFYLFSDYQSMFIRGSEEFCYIADLA